LHLHGKHHVVEQRGVSTLTWCTCLLRFKAEPSLVLQLTTEVYCDTKPDLSIFHKYAYRVRKLDAAAQHPPRALRGGYRYLDFVDDLGALLYYAVPSPLLPNLRHLTWAPATSVNLLRHLLSPHLLSLKIPNNHWVSESSPFALTKIPELCPKIKSLTLQIQCGDHPTMLAHIREPAQSCMSQVICSWGDLEELDCNVITTRGVLRLSALSSLRILRLQINNLAVVDLPSDSLSFPSLHTLQLKADTADTITTFIKAMKNLPKSLKIDAFPPHYRRGSCSQETVGRFLRLIADTSHCELRNFSMNLPSLGDDPVDVADMLRPLFSCCELRTLHVRISSQFTLGDDNLRMMATTWPQLEELELIDIRRPRPVGYLAAPTPAAGPEVTPPPPLQPQTLITTMGPGHPTQPPTPPQVVGPVQTPQPQNLPIPVTYLHMDPQPLPVPVVNHGQPPHLQHLPVIPHPMPPTIQIAQMGHSPFLRTAEITFHGLISLLELCPNIRYFDLAIDATRLEGLEGDNPGGGVCNRLVREARLIDSPISDSLAVARILLDILPDLDDLAGSPFPWPFHPHHHMIPQRWLQVRQTMRDSRT